VREQDVPPQYLPGMAQAAREAARNRLKQAELQKKAKPRHQT
jgi:hypothetical protein